MKLEERLEIFELLTEYVNIENKCWLWKRAIKKNGYGVQRYNGKQQYVHRLMALATYGTIKGNSVVDHLCHTRHCINPEHLRICSQIQNTWNRSPKTKNKSGFVNIEENTTRKGVTYTVKITKDQKQYYGGTYHNLKTAIKARSDLRYKLYGVRA